MLSPFTSSVVRRRSVWRPHLRYIIYQQGRFSFRIQHTRRQSTTLWRGWDSCSWRCWYCWIVHRRYWRCHISSRFNRAHAHVHTRAHERTNYLWLRDCCRHAGFHVLCECNGRNRRYNFVRRHLNSHMSWFDFRPGSSRTSCRWLSCLALWLGREDDSSVRLCRCDDSCTRCDSSARGCCYVFGNMHVHLRCRHLGYKVWCPTFRDMPRHPRVWLARELLTPWRLSANENYLSSCFSPMAWCELVFP